MRERDPLPGLAWGLAGAYLIYAAGFIYAGSFMLAGERQFMLFDDAMISMRFAKHLAQGAGLVWNLGSQRVEGFTNPLWTFYMALWHLLPLGPALQPLAIQATGALLLAYNLLLVFRLARRMVPGSNAAGYAAMLLCGAYLPLNFFGLYGMEVCALVVVLDLALLRLLDRDGAPDFDPWTWALLGTATLIRIDLVVPAGLLLLLRVARLRQGKSGELLKAGGLLALFLVAQTGLRLWYYGTPLPNTYYLKMTGFPGLLRTARGAWVLMEFMRREGWVFFAMAGLGAALSRRLGAAWLALLCAGQAAYSVYVGGDAWEYWGGSNRYLCLAMPAFFVLLAAAGARIHAWGAVRVAPSAWRGAWCALAVAVLGASILRLNMIDGHAGPLKELALLRPPHNLDGNRGIALRAERVLPLCAPDATVTVTWAGTVPYLFERNYIDLLGKSDIRVAHEPMHRDSGLPGAEQLPDWQAFYPGHMKWDYAYSIGQLGPDMVLDLWTHPEQAAPYLERDYVPLRVDGQTVYLRRGSPRIDWKAAAALGRLG